MVAGILATLFISESVYAQSAPQKMSYQAVIRDGSNVLVSGKNIGMRISILQDTGTVYVETHVKATNANGLVTLDIGTGNVVSGVFGDIDWDKGPYNLKLETDIAGGSNYTLTSLRPINSVAYSLWSWNSTCCNNQWHIGGNNNTNAATHFLGTTNNQSLNFRVNGQKAGQIEHNLFNTFFGYQSGNGTPTGKWNSGFGNQSLRDLTTGHDNTALGDEVLTHNRTGNQNTGVGEGSLFSSVSGHNNTAAGYTALGKNVSGHSNVAVGVSAMYQNQSLSYQVAVGDSSLYYTGFGFNAATPKGAGIDNTAIGSKSLYLNVEGASNTATGFHSLLNNTSGNNNTAVGRKALFANKTGDMNSAFGHEADVAGDTLNNATAIGAQAMAGASNSLILGSISGINGASASTNVGIGTTTPETRLHLVGSIKIADGTQGSGKVLTSDANGLASWQAASGSVSDTDDWTLNGNIVTDQHFIGTTNNKPLKIKVNNVDAGNINNSNASIFMGYQSGTGITTGQGNTAFGNGAMQSTTSGHLNTAMGFNALFSNTTSNGNLAAGQAALYSNTTGGFNTAVGQNALVNNTTGELNSALGSGADVSSGTFSNATAIGARAYVTSSNSLVLGAINGINGSLAGTNVGIGTTAPTARLHVEGKIKMVDGTEGLNKVLTSDAAGLSSWKDLSTLSASDSTDWSLSGNHIGDNDFIGSLNNKPLQFKVNNSPSGKIDATLENTFIGYLSGNGSMTGTNNVALGAHALKFNTTGANNTATGRASLRDNTTGTGNTATGSSALVINTTGSANTGIGHQALRSNTTGNNNTAVGFSTLVNSNGNDNTAVGLNALQANTTGSSQVAIGLNALIFNTTGNNNTAIGEGALMGNTTGSNNTAIGKNANVSSNNLTNATAIGNGAVACASNNMMFGNSSVTGWGFGTCAGSNAITVGTNSTNGNGASLTPGGTWTSTSDSTKKYNIQSLHYGLEEVLKLKPVSYMFKGSNTRDIGFLAQEVKLLIPEVVYGSEGHMTMSYAQLTTVLVKAMQQQQGIIEQLQKDQVALKNEMSSLRTEIDLIKKQASENSAVAER